jgi:RNA polymerase sigma-70 factor (ECF subfamily)
MQEYAMGSKEAFRILFDRYETKLRHFLSLRMSGGLWSEQEDVFQVVWLKIHQARKQFNPQKRFSAWFFAIAWNSLYDRYRKLNFDEDEGDWEVTEASSLGSDALLSLKQDLLQLSKLLKELSPRQREVLLLSDFEELSAEEISKILEISSGAVRQDLFRARQILRRKWKNS